MKCKDLKVYVENIDCYMLASLEGCLQKWIDDHQSCEIVDFREIKDRLIIFYKEEKAPEVPLKIGYDEDSYKKLSERGWA
jgi:hypothetical protein